MDNLIIFFIIISIIILIVLMIMIFRMWRYQEEVDANLEQFADNVTKLKDLINKNNK